jgi:hypothetical protein
MSVSRDEFRLAMLSDGIDGWAPLQWPFGYAAESFPEMSEGDRDEMVAELLRGLLASSLIAVAYEPEGERSARPLSPNEGRRIIDAIQVNPAAAGANVGYVTTRPGAVEWQGAELCQACDGYVSKLAVDQVEFERGMVGGLVAVCADHREVAAWPDGAADAVAESISDAVDAVRVAPSQRLH